MATPTRRSCRRRSGCCSAAASTEPENFMTTQQITVELRQWILEQARAGHAQEQVLAAMLGSGWEEGVARQALDQTLNGHLQKTGQAAEPDQPRAVPAPDLAGARPLLPAGDREVKVLLSLQHPRVVVFGGLLSDEECDAMVALAGARLARSETVATGGDGSEVN